MSCGEWFLGGATIFLGLIAAGAIVANFIIRSLDIDREHKRQTFREILDWAKRGIELFSEYQLDIEIRTDSKILETRLRTLWAESLGIVSSAKALGDKVLARDVKEAVDKLHDYFAIGKKIPRKTTPTDSECEAEFTSLLGIASSRKAKLKL